MNLVDRLLDQPRDRMAVIAADSQLTYGELADRVGEWSAALRAQFEPQTRIGLISGNDADFVTAYLATLHSGCVCVPLNPLSPGPELLRELEDVTPEAVIVGAGGMQAAPAIEQTLTERGVKVFQRGAQWFDDAIGTAGASSDSKQVDPDDPALLLFTSGTAGLPKAAILTHGNLIASLQSVMSMSIDFESEPQRALAVVPLFHVMGLNVVVNLGLRVGATLILEDHTRPERTATLLTEHQVTLMSGPPTMWAALAEVESLEGLESIKVAVSGAAPLDSRVAAKLQATHGITVREGYGLTETCGTVSSAVGELDSPIGSVGRIMPGVQCRLVDSNGADVYVGDVGEILVKGPMVSPGYWEDPAATAACRTPDGWLKTGDLAVVDDDGFLAIVNRVKDLIIVSGFNVHPAEVELILEEHPAVGSAGVAGEPDPVTGERIAAYATLKPGAAVEPEELRQHCMGQLARYKVPKRVEIVEALPVGLVGKLRRQDLGG